MQSTYDPKLKTKLTITMTILAFVIFSFYSFVLVPLSIKAATDVSFMVPLLSDLLPYLKYLTEIAGMLLMYSFIIYAAYRFGKSGASLYAALFLVLVLYEYITSHLVTYILAGRLPDFSDFLFDFMYMVAIPVLIICAIHAIILLIIYVVFKNTGDSSDKAAILPFKKLYSRENHLQRVALYISTLFAASQIVNLIITDLSIGAPSNLGELLWMVVSYLTSLLMLPASYLFIIYILISLNNKDIRMKYDV